MHVGCQHQTGLDSRHLPESNVERTLLCMSTTSKCLQRSRPARDRKAQLWADRLVNCVATEQASSAVSLLNGAVSVVTVGDKAGNASIPLPVKSTTVVLPRTPLRDGGAAGRAADGRAIAFFCDAPLALRGGQGRG